MISSRSASFAFPGFVHSGRGQGALPYLLHIAEVVGCGYQFVVAAVEKLYQVMEKSGGIGRFEKSAERQLLDSLPQVNPEFFGFEQL